MNKQPKYLSYLVRLWPVAESQECRVVLEEVGSGERVGFSDLEALFDHLRGQVERAAWAEERHSLSK